MKPLFPISILVSNGHFLGKTEEKITFLRLGSETFFADSIATGRKIHYPIHEAVFSLFGALLKIEDLGKL